MSDRLPSKGRRHVTDPLAFLADLRALSEIAFKVRRLGRRRMLDGLSEMNEGTGYPPEKLLTQMNALQRDFARIRRKLQ